MTAHVLLLGMMLCASPTLTVGDSIEGRGQTDLSGSLREAMRREGHITLDLGMADRPMGTAFVAGKAPSTKNAKVDLLITGAISDTAAGGQQVLHISLVASRVGRPKPVLEFSTTSDFTDRATYLAAIDTAVGQFVDKLRAALASPAGTEFTLEANGLRSKKELEEFKKLVQKLPLEAEVVSAKLKGTKGLLEVVSAHAAHEFAEALSGQELARREITVVGFDEARLSVRVGR